MIAHAGRGVEESQSDVHRLGTTLINSNKGFIKIPQNADSVIVQIA